MANERKLILVKHAMPVIDPMLPPNQWRLSEAGRESWRALAERLATYDPVAIVASMEPKATETGEIVAELLDKPFRTAPNLHEHDRSNTTNLSTQQEFERQVKRFFAHPSDLIFGLETADAAHQRFRAAIGSVLQEHQNGNVVVVAHGTVITLFVSRLTELEPFPFWQQLGLPSIVVLSVPDFALLALEPEIR